MLQKRRELGAVGVVLAKPVPAGRLDFHHACNGFDSKQGLFGKPRCAVVWRISCVALIDPARGRGA